MWINPRSNLTGFDNIGWDRRKTDARNVGNARYLEFGGCDPEAQNRQSRKDKSLCAVR
jgi:hypothetical protein